MKVAIFDFDGTLFPEETFPIMMRHLKNHPQHKRKYSLFLTRVLPVYIAYKCRLYPEQKMKQFSMQSYISSFGSTPQKDIEHFFEEIGEQMRQGLSQAVLERIEQHKHDGCYTMLVSGAFEPLLHAVTKHIKFDSIIGTNVPIKNGQVDKHTPITHMNGKTKSETVLAHLANKEVDWPNSFAYSDSYSDISLLEMVGNPVAVNPDQRLLQVASERRWEILSH